MMGQEVTSPLGHTGRRHTDTLQVSDLKVRYGGGSIQVLRGCSFSIAPGEILGLAGESGSGKSTAALAIMGLLPRTAILSGSILLEGQELLGLPDRQMRNIRGRDVAAIFQETTTALNPVVRIGDQLVRAVRTHDKGLSKSDAISRVRESLKRVRLNDPDRVMNTYAGQLSGGMSQRVLIAMALSCGSRLLLADEPTTALDVSVQEEILVLMRSMADDGLSILLVSHDLGVLNEITDRLMVLYAGEIVETGQTRDLITAPQHPYTQALLGCVPRMHNTGSVRFTEIPERQGGQAFTSGCLFRDRCSRADAACESHPELVSSGKQLSRCWHPVGH